MMMFNVWWLVTAVFLDLASRTSTQSIPKDALVQVEANLMSLFGLKRRPNVDRSKVVVPEEMLDMYRRQNGQYFDTVSIAKPGLHTASANTVRSFTHVESPIDEKFRGHHRFRFKFDTRTVPAYEQVKAAELLLTRATVDWLSEEGDGAKEHYQQVIVHDIIRPGIKGKRESITRVVDSKRIDTRRNSSLSLDVLPAVERWLENPSRNHGLLVHVYGLGKNGTTPARHVRLRRDASEDERTWSRRQPILYTYTDDGRDTKITGEEIVQKRLRRAAMKKKRRKDHEPCRRYPMYVDFTEVGWNNWIVAPPGYDAFHCHGDCNFPYAEHMNTTNHAIVQTLVNSVNPSQVPKPCCVPTQLTSISMLYLDDSNKVVLKNYKEMAVGGCGCR